MGLLTDPNSKQRTQLAVTVARFYTPLSWVCYLGGLALLLLLPHPWYSNRTYFSENALLPGLVTSHYSEERAAQQYHVSLREEGEKYPGQAPFPWIQAQFRQLGLEVHTQPFTLTYPLSEGRNFTGTNVYAILRAPKASSTEALVLCAPHRPPNSPHPNTDAGIAVLLSMAKYFRPQIYWAKDIIFLVTEHEFLGTQAWLEGYHGVSYGQGVLAPGPLPARAGSIQAAVNLELSTEFPTHINIKVLGLNGQLPNLDLVNLVNRLVMREGMHVMFQGVEEHPRPDSMNGYTRSLRTLLSMMAGQAAGVPSGNHGLFHRFGIESVTLEGRTVSSRKRSPADFHVLGRLVEGTFRSLNNLLERFHQSFFFYLLCSGSRYVSIGLYMPVLGLLAAGFLLTAVGGWMHLLSVEGGGKEQRVPAVFPAKLGKVVPVLLAAHCLGLLALSLPRHAATLGAGLGILPEEAVPLSLGALSLLLILLPAITRPRLAVPQGCGPTAQVVCCLELAALAGCTGLSNISLAILVTLPYLPLALLARPTQGLRKVVLVTFTILCHPLMLSGVAVLVDTIRTFPSSSPGQLWARTTSAWQSAIVFAVVDQAIYGNVLFTLATTCLLPVWTLLYLTLFAQEEQKEKEE